MLNAALRERRLAEAPEIVTALPDAALPELRPVLTTMTSVLLETLVLSILNPHAAIASAAPRMVARRLGSIDRRPGVDRPATRGGRKRGHRVARKTCANCRRTCGRRRDPPIRSFQHVLEIKFQTGCQLVQIVTQRVQVPIRARRLFYPLREPHECCRVGHGWGGPVDGV